MKPFAESPLKPETIKYLQPVLEWLEAGAPRAPKKQLAGFNMAMFQKQSNPADKSCGSICCIAGAVAQFNKDVAPKWHIENDIDRCYAVGENIGLTNEQSNKLFFANDGYGDLYGEMSNIPVGHAAATLRRFMETGEIVWEGR